MSFIGVLINWDVGSTTEIKQYSGETHTENPASHIPHFDFGIRQPAFRTNSLKKCPQSTGNISAPGQHSANTTPSRFVLANHYHQDPRVACQAQTCSARKSRSAPHRDGRRAYMLRDHASTGVRNATSQRKFAAARGAAHRRSTAMRACNSRHDKRRSKGKKEEGEEKTACTAHKRIPLTVHVFAPLRAPIPPQSPARSTKFESISNLTGGWDEGEERRRQEMRPERGGVRKMRSEAKTSGGADNGERTSSAWVVRVVIVGSVGLFAEKAQRMVSRRMANFSAANGCNQGSQTRIPRMCKAEEMVIQSASTRSKPRRSLKEATKLQKFRGAGSIKLSRLCGAGVVAFRAARLGGGGGIERLWGLGRRRAKADGG
ncbi:hypothetical protein B0H19DRAFT_1327697 [Mycena capillaripes]|nr:hypothetical protein B0H19DRAFT_1327697 [Mycena capillaripes]